MSALRLDVLGLPICLRLLDPSCSPHLHDLRVLPQLLQVQAPPRFGALGKDDEHALQPLEAFAPGLTGTPGNTAASLCLFLRCLLLLEWFPQHTAQFSRQPCTCS